MTGQAIAVSVPSDVAPLREVVVGPVKPFSFEDLIAEAEPQDPEVSRAFLAHNRFALPDPEVAAAEHERFVAVLRAEGVRVHQVDRLDTVVMQVYPRDLGFAIDGAFFLARPRTGARRREQAGLGRLLPRLSRVIALDDGVIEGGDVIVTATEVIVGLSEHTDAAGVEALRRALAALGSDRLVVPLEFSHRGVIHLDVKLTMVGPALALCETAAFTPASRRWLEARFELIEATAAEARDLAVNTLATGPDRVVVAEGADRIAARLRARGVTPVPVDFTQIARFPGAFRCATLPLVRGEEGT
jgi:N-dimethylarginine dimethylaminohydrolase